MSVWVMPSVIDVYENFLKRSQAVAGGRRRSQAVGTPKGVGGTIANVTTQPRIHEFITGLHEWRGRK